MSNIPKYSRNDELKASFGYAKAADSKKFSKNLAKNCYINVFSIKTWLKSASVKNILLDGIEDELIEQFNILGLDPENIPIEDVELCTL